MSDHSKNSWVYFIRVGENGPVKIGRSRSPTDRLANAQTHNPEKLYLVAVEAGNARAEMNYHKRFAHLRLHGEWFSVDEELQQLINDLGRPLIIKCKPHADFA